MVLLDPAGINVVKKAVRELDFLYVKEKHHSLMSINQGGGPISQEEGV